MLQSLLISLLVGFVPSVYSHDHDHKHEHQSNLAAHQHGRVSLEMAIDGNRAVVEIRGPAESFLGFEHKPKTKAQKNQLAALEKKLRSEGLTYIGFAAQLNCKQSKHTVDWHFDHGEHADLKASYEFTCAEVIAKTSLTIALKKSFERIKTVDVAVLPSSGTAFAREVTKAHESIDIP